jgi:hypothetical protein
LGLWAIHSSYESHCNGNSRFLLQAVFLHISNSSRIQRRA